MRFRTAVLLAFVGFVALFALRFTYLIYAERADDGSGSGSGSGYGSQSEPFENSRKNYASAKSVQGQPLGDTQKFEKIGTLTQTTSAFVADRKRVLEQIAADGGVIQLERAQGLSGRRRLNLGIGVPPDKFDGFIDKARHIGRLTHLEVVKNDKTNEYLQLRAKRATLEKTRAALEKLQQPDNKVDEKLNVLNRLTEVEQQIQDLGVSLGDYDAANELCTVKLTLVEAKGTPVRFPVRRLLAVGFMALAWTVPYYLAGSLGLFALAFALWIVPITWRLMSALTKSVTAERDTSGGRAPSG